MPRRKDSEHLSKDETIYFVEDTGNKLKTPVNFLQSLKILLKEKPDVIITTGAGSALSLCYLGKFFRKKIIFIESFSRVTTPSLFGRLVAPISDLVIVQWEPLLKYYKKAVCGGSIFNFPLVGKEKKENYILLTIGTVHFSFDRLLKEVDRLIDIGAIHKKVIAQIGNSTYKPKNYEYFDFCSSEKIPELMMNASIVITHGGIGSIVNSLMLGKPTIVVPRYKKFHEHINDHQLDITHELEKEDAIIPVYNISNMQNALRQTEKFKNKKFTLSNDKIQDIIQKWILNLQ
ncbi:MAG: hypothetical protein L6265_12345 [Thermoplasmatales archaeon]|nr:hypothetical protein [Thermoplasmatales archaeon]